jgi:hypothetical protein
MLEAKLEGKRWPTSSTREHEQQVQLCCKALFDQLVNCVVFVQVRTDSAASKRSRSMGLGQG